MSILRSWVYEVSDRLNADKRLRSSVKDPSPNHSNSGYVIDIEGSSAIAQFIAWPSLGYESTVLDSASGECVYIDSGSVSDLGQLYECWDRFVATLQKFEP